MNDPNFNQLLSEVLDLPKTDRRKLVRELTASLGSASASLATPSVYRQRMRNYTEHAWALAKKTLTV